MTFPLKYRRFFKVVLTISIIVVLRHYISGVIATDEFSVDAVISPGSPVKKFFTDAEFIGVDNDFQGNIKVFDPSGKLIGGLISTLPASSHISGYAGPTPVLIAVSGDDVIVGTHLLKNSETPAFDQAVRASGLLESFHGLHLREASQKDIDAVTGATFTSKSVICSIRHTLTALEADSKAEREEEGLLSAKIPSESRFDNIRRAIAHIPFSIAITFLIVAAAFFTAVMDFPGKQKARTVILLFSLIWLGFARAELISIDLIIRWVVRGVFTVATAGLLMIAMATIFVSVVKGKALYCHYICPFGAMQEFAGKIFPWKVKISKRLFLFLSKIRYAVLLAVAGSILIFPFASFSQIEPFAAFAFTTAGELVVFIAGFSLFFSLFIPRFWCVFLCPTGAFFELFRDIIPTGGKIKKLSVAKPPNFR